jgi:hypothetical protein
MSGAPRVQFGAPVFDAVLISGFSAPNSKDLVLNKFRLTSNELLLNKFSLKGSLDTLRRAHPPDSSLDIAPVKYESYSIVLAQTETSKDPGRVIRVLNRDWPH